MRGESRLIGALLLEVIDMLISMNSDWTTKMKKQYQFYPRVINLSDVQLNMNEQRLLEKGLKFVVPPSNAEIGVVNLTADLATRLRGNGNLVDQCADFVRNCNQKIDVIPDSTSKMIKDIVRKSMITI